jgi:membrane-associated phospholipid phosphatase
MTTTEDEHDIVDQESSGTPPAAEGTSGGGTPPSGHQPFSAWLAERWTDPGKRRVSIGWLLLLASLVVYFFIAGIPWSTNSVLIYVMAGLVISSLGTGVRWRRLLLDWIPLIAVLFVYGLLRGYASHTLWGPFYAPQVWFDSHIFGGVAPTVQLQRWLYTPGLHFWDYLVWACYMSHFFASFIVAGVLWKTNHAKFRRYVPLFVGLTIAGYITYVLYPAMPPWMSSQFGHLPHTTRIIDQVWKHLHLHLGESLFAGGDKFDNNVAAMPSLHGAYPMLICLFFWKGSSVRKRLLLAAYPICMAFSLVYTGEHFVIDIFVGWIYAFATFYFGSKLLDRWQARQLRKRLGDGLEELEPALVSSSGLNGSGLPATSHATS